MLNEFSDRYPPDPPPSRWARAACVVVVTLLVTIFVYSAVVTVL